MDKTLSVLLIVFVTIIMGVLLASEIANVVYENVNPIGSFNETLDITAARRNSTGVDNQTGFNVSHQTAGREITEITNIKMGNGTAFTVNTDYIENITTNNTAGRIFFQNVTKVQVHVNNSNLTYVTYKYESEQYVQHQISRTLLNIVLPLFFIIALVVFVIFAIKNNLVDKVLKGT